jgi:hypothetical protein
MTQVIHDAVRKMVEFEMKQDEWDMGPFVVVFYPGDDGTLRRFILSLGMIDGPLPELLYFMGELLLQPEDSEHNPFPPLPKGVLGIAVRWEGWGIKFESLEEQITYANSDHGAIADDPRGFETLGVMGVDPDGIISMGFNRGDTEISVETFTDNQPTGRLPEAAQHFFEGVQAYGIRCMNKSV